MLFEVVTTTSMAGAALAAYYQQNKAANSDHDKIIKIAEELGLKTKDTKNGRIRLYRSSRKGDVAEYVYKMPLGLSFKKFQENKHAFIDGLNTKSEREFDIRNLKNVKNMKDFKWKQALREQDWKRQLKDIFEPRIKIDKYVEMSYDGMLKFKVYERGLDKMYQYNRALLSRVKGWEFPVGFTRDGLVKHDFDKMQMMVIAGMTRYGKTVALKNIITTMVLNNPDDVEFTLIDLKGGLAFNRFSKLKQVKRVAKNASEMLHALEAIHVEMLERQAEFLHKGYEDIGEAGYKKRHFVIIDEGAEIAGFIDEKERDRCTHLIGEIARIGAGLSYRMVFATQYPTADVFPRTIKSNTSAALSFRLKTSGHSKVVLDKTGAEELQTGLFGRVIYQSDREVELQTPFISNEFIDEEVRVHLCEKKLEEGRLLEGKNPYERKEAETGALSSFEIEDAT